jgi:hypothetical protein
MKTRVLELRRGAVAACWGIVLLAVAAVPSRFAGVIKGWGPLGSRLVRAAGGALLDLAAALMVGTPILIVLAIFPLVLKPLRRPLWQRAAGLVAALPLGFALWVFTVTAQEVKSERGSFPTFFDVTEGGTSASFIGGMVGFLAYDRVRLPALVGIGLSVAVLLLWRRFRDTPPVPWSRWVAGFVAASVGGTAVIVMVQSAVARINRLSPAALGDPLTGIIESGIDLSRHRGPTTARDLVLTAVFPQNNEGAGAALVGWPSLGTKCTPHPAARPLDASGERDGLTPRGQRLMRAFSALSEVLFTSAERPIAVFFVSLEGFRADDIHALNPAAPREIAPFVSSLYERAPNKGSGLVAARKMYQAGVRTAHNLGAMACGLGTLPYNLAFVRDLQPFPMRCASDVLADAGFRHSFFYGSDASFDEMHRFFLSHRYTEIVSQAELPRTLPKGTWEAVTDFAVFDVAARRVAERLAQSNTSQFAMLMSLSNHSPFTKPDDLPAEVEARVRRSLEVTTHRADGDDTRRLLAFSYTDAALEELVKQVEALGIADRSIIIFMADHSTGHPYVWGAEATETDDQKAQIPFGLIVPPALRQTLRDPVLFDEALAEADTALNLGPVSLNDVPTLLLALLSSHASLRALPQEARWHTMGGQVTSPHFKPPSGEMVLSINGVSELFALNESGARIGDYQDSVFLKTRADRYRVTPLLIPVSSALQRVMRCAPEGVGLSH